MFEAALASAGAFLVGRRLYDLTNGWNARPPADAPMVVLTHDPPDDWPRGGVQIVFATDIESAVAKASELRRGPRRGGGRRRGVTGLPRCRSARRDHREPHPGRARQGHPVVRGLRRARPAEDPEIVAAEGVTHLSYRLRR